mgnify:CR=1 FL=1
MPKCGVQLLEPLMKVTFLPHLQCPRGVAEITSAFILEPLMKVTFLPHLQRSQDVAEDVADIVSAFMMYHQ